jgi:3-oxoacyl-[acyl-carrier-protein] synthase II
LSKRRVVVTGLGIVSPVGSDIATAWDNVRSGRSGIGPVTHFDAEKFATRIAGEVRDFDVGDYLEPKAARKCDPFIHYGMAAGIQSIRDSGLEITEDNADRIGVAIAAGIGGIHTIERNHQAFLDQGPRRISPFFVPGTIINMISGNLSIDYNLRGPNLAMVTACTTATHNIGLAARLIAWGEADAMVAGGAEYATTPIGMGGFTAARALSTRNDEPEKASRPWDKDRDGFVLSDGAGVLMLEEYEQAKKRGANIYAELTGFGMSADAHHMTSPPEDGMGAQRCMRLALQDAKVNASEVGYINAHGTSTQVGDVAECRAVKAVFGGEADNLVVTSTKSMTGHLLGAAGGVEAIFTILSLRDQVVSPTINLDNPDEGCDLDFVPHEARDMQLDVALSNSFGFGGTNGTLVFRRPD